MTYSDNQGPLSPRKRKRAGRRHGPRQLSMEPLEDRRMRAVLTVTNLDDLPVFAVGDAPGTLRQAIFDANLSSGDDEIVFDAALTSGGPATINLTSAGDLLIQSNMTIGGPGASLLTIRAFDPTAAIKNGDGARIFRIETSPEGSFVTLQGLTLTGGDVTGSGGAILNGGILTVNACTINDNSAAAAAQVSGGGIAISASASATVTDSTISGNLARGDYAYGGGISAAGYLSVVRSMISGNQADAKGNSYGIGGGIEVSTGVVAKITDSTVSGNLAEGTRARGGGISAAGDLTVERSQISGNKAEGQGNSYGGGISALAQVVVTDCEISSNEASLLILPSGTAQGGGIDSRQSLMVSGSSIFGNRADIFGGGISAKSLAIISNSTLSGNSASRGGGLSVGADASGSATVAHTTITANSGDDDAGGVHVASGANASLDHTIVAGNTLSSNARQDISGSVFARHSLIGDDTGATVFDIVGNLIGHSATPIDPKLDPLFNNGGPNRTHVPLVGSPVIDAGDPALMVGMDGVPPTDQRGTPFTRVYDGSSPAGARIDIGAVEWQAHPTPELIGDFNLDGTVDSADYTRWRDTLGALVEPNSGADADGNGKIETADYGLWKLHFGDTLNLTSSAAGGGSITLAAAAESTPQAELRIAPQAADAGILVTTARYDESNHAVRPRSAVAGVAPADHALVAWFASLQKSSVRPSANDDGRDSRAEGPTPTRECDAARAADAVFQTLGTRRSRSSPHR